MSSTLFSKLNVQNIKISLTEVIGECSLPSSPPRLHSSFVKDYAHLQV